MPRWYMEEMDIAYDLVELSLAQGQNLKEDFLSINPFGKLPAMKDDSVVDAKGDPLVIFESGAVPDQKTKTLSRLLTELDSEIAKGFFINNKWGAADCAITSYLAYIKLFFPNEDLSEYPTVNTLIHSTRERPAYRKVMGLN